jgi:hypothetical protein
MATSAYQARGGRVLHTHDCGAVQATICRGRIAVAPFHPGDEE